MMADSAPGSKQQIGSSPDARLIPALGEIIETPSRRLSAGSTVLQYFIRPCARKAWRTRAKTADSGPDPAPWTWRRTSHHVTTAGRSKAPGHGITRGSIIESLRDRIVGRVTLEDIYDR